MTSRQNYLLGAAIAGLCLTHATVAVAQSGEPQGPVAPRHLEQPADTDVGSFLRGIVNDFRVFATSPATYSTLGVGSAASAGVRPLDQQIATSRFNGELYQSAGFASTFEAGEVLGGTLVQVGGAVATYGVGRFTAHDGLVTLGRDLIRVQILNGAVTQTLKYTVGRERPDGSSRRSFPSGHSSGTFATATVLHRHYGWKVGLPAFGVASYVAASRLSEHKHYLSDVVFGAAIGLAAGRAVTVTRGATRFDVTPVVAPRLAGVQVTVGR